MAQLEAVAAAEGRGELLGRAAARALTAPDLSGDGADESGEVAWAALEAARPAEVRQDVWCGMFEFVAWKLTLLLGPHQLLPFARDLCDPGRFAQLKLTCGGS